MRYVDRVLQPGESIRYVTTVSWVGYLPGLFLWLVAIVVLIVFWPPSQRSVGFELIAWIAFLAPFVVGAVLLIKHWWHRWTTEIAVTDRRIIYKIGFIKRRTNEMNMDKVVSVDVEQTLLGRLLNYGDIKIQGPSDTEMEEMFKVDGPIEFRNHVTAE